MQVAHPPSHVARPAPVEVVYSQFVDLAKRGYVSTALVDESSSTLHFTLDQEQMRQDKLKNERGMRWYQRPSSSTSAEEAKLPLRQCSTRVVDKDTSFVQVRPRLLFAGQSALTGHSMAAWYPQTLFAGS